MQMIFAVVKPFKLDDVREVLLENSVNGITVIEGKGFGRQKGHSTVYRGAEYDIDYLPKVVVFTLVPDKQVKQIKKDIIRVAGTDKMGDGIVWSIPMENYTRIRNGEVVTDEVK